MITKYTRRTTGGPQFDLTLSEGEQWSVSENRCLDWLKENIWWQREETLKTEVYPNGRTRKNTTNSRNNLDPIRQNPRRLMTDHTTCVSWVIPEPVEQCTTASPEISKGWTPASFFMHPTITVISFKTEAEWDYSWGVFEVQQFHFAHMGSDCSNGR